MTLPNRCSQLTDTNFPKAPKEKPYGYTPDSLVSGLVILVYPANEERNLHQHLHTYTKHLFSSPDGIDRTKRQMT